MTAPTMTSEEPKTVAARLRAMLDRCLTGGNHLASELIGECGADFHELDGDTILSEHGLHWYEVWCCWRALKDVGEQLRSIEEHDRTQMPDGDMGPCKRCGDDNGDYSPCPATALAAALTRVPAPETRGLLGDRLVDCARVVRDCCASVSETGWPCAGHRALREHLDKPQSEQAGGEAAESPAFKTAKAAFWRKRAEILRKEKDEAYRERNRLVAVLARLFPSGIRRTDIPGWDPEWHGCVFIDLPTGQASWHYHDSEAAQFAALPPYTKPWDGHTTEEKYGRLAALLATPSPAHGACGGCEDERELLDWATDPEKQHETLEDLPDARDHVCTPAQQPAPVPPRREMVGCDAFVRGKLSPDDCMFEPGDHCPAHEMLAKNSPAPVPAPGGRELMNEAVVAVHELISMEECEGYHGCAEKHKALAARLHAALADAAGGEWELIKTCVVESAEDLGDDMSIVWDGQGPLPLYAGDRVLVYRRKAREEAK